MQKDRALGPKEFRIDDNRKFARYGMEIQTMVSWWDHHGSFHRQESVTRDLSAGGAFLLASACPAVGAEVRFHLLLPPLGGSHGPMRMRVKGRVLRLEATPGDGQRGFAACCEKFSLWDAGTVDGAQLRWSEPYEGVPHA